MAGHLPQDIPECWRVKCVVEAYDELFIADKEKKESKEAKKNGTEIKEIKETKRTKFNFGKIKEKNKR